MKRKSLEMMSDVELQDCEDLINEIQAERRAATPDPIDAEREAVVASVANFFRRLKNCDSLDQMWK